MTAESPIPVVSCTDGRGEVDLTRDFHIWRKDRRGGKVRGEYCRLRREVGEGSLRDMRG